MTIPASHYVTINPQVIGAGGQALQLNGVILTHDTAVPIGAVLPFSSADAVSNFFGPTSTEAGLAAIYFKGWDESTVDPALLYFAQYPAASVAGYVRGGSLAGMTLAQLQALSGVLTVSVDGTPHTSSSINLSAATSFSNAATLIAAGFTGLGGVVSYDSQRQAFVITSSTTGASSLVGYCSGSLSAGLLMTQATGAVTSAGAVAGVPATNMQAVVAVTQNWATFMTVWEPDLTNKLAFAAWVNTKNDRYGYAAWDTDVTATQANTTSSFGWQCDALAYDGIYPVYNTPQLAAFVLGVIASINFDATNGRITLAYKKQAGLATTVSDETIATNLEANGYNYYGAVATANDNFSYFYPGSTSGQYDFIDEYVNQIYLNSQLQLSTLSLLTQINSIPYNAQGYGLLDAAFMDPINAAVNFGSIRPGVPLSALQAAEVNNAAGVKIDGVLSTRGWYLQILPATAQVRAARGSPPMSFWYMDGGSVQRVNLASILVQ